mgnify:CR=1 FL=1
MFLFDEIIDDVNNDNSPLLKKIHNKNFTNADIDLYKFNIITLINEVKPNYISDLENNDDITNPDSSSTTTCFGVKYLCVVINSLNDSGTR